MDVNTYLELKKRITTEFENMKNNRLNYPLNYSEGYLEAINNIDSIIDNIYRKEHKITNE